jgi:hypothetical protein
MEFGGRINKYGMYVVGAAALFRRIRLAQMAAQAAVSGIGVGGAAVTAEMTATRSSSSAARVGGAAARVLFWIWLVIGLIVYFSYSLQRSQLAKGD